MNREREIALGVECAWTPLPGAPVILAMGRLIALLVALGTWSWTWSMDSRQGVAGAESHRARLDTDPERRAPGKNPGRGRYLPVARLTVPRLASSGTCWPARRRSHGFRPRACFRHAAPGAEAGTA